MPELILPDPRTDFSGWYQDLLTKADLAENGPVRGTMVIRPWGFAIWERMQLEVDQLLKARGVQNVYLPLLIPNSYLEREAEHIEGFSPELAVVTHAGGEELSEPAVVRPTSETLFGDVMSRWVQSYRDLPLVLNQWANVVRWELRPRMFLRTSEFLWQEGHTAHSSEEQAREYAEGIHTDVYGRFFQDKLAMSAFAGEKTAHERFAGAIRSLSVEGMMRDGKALQLATSHELGTNFAKAFNIQYSDQGGTLQHCWTTSWGSSTRMVGGLIMSHGDEHGLVLPPAIAPVQVVVVAIDDSSDVLQSVDVLVSQLTDVGVRASTDTRADVRLGRRRTDWELKGVPLRVEVGQREVENGEASVVSRVDGQRDKWPLSGVAPRALEKLAEVQAQMLDDSSERLVSQTQAVAAVADIDEKNHTGFWRLPWAEVGESGEALLRDRGLTVRCLIDGSRDGPDAIVAKAY